MPIGRPARGRCKVRGRKPYLWALAAEAMDFLVIRMGWADLRFQNLMQGYGIQARTIKFGKY